MAREQLCSGGGAHTFHTNRFFTYNPSDKKKAKPFFFLSIAEREKTAQQQSSGQGDILYGG